MGKAQTQDKAAAAIAQDVTSTLPAEPGEEQISLLQEQETVVPVPEAAEQENVESVVTGSVDMLPEVESNGPCMLDRERPYGEVCGSAGVAYEQDGKCFDRAGMQVNTDLEA